MKFKRILAAAAALICLACGVSAAAADTAAVYVTVADGNLKLAQERIEVTDTDGDGKLTVNDALYAAHEAKYEGGAAAGYAFEETEYGLSLTKLWGVENGGSYGYYVNNASAMSLADEIKDGDYINAYVYTDTDTFSDVYTYFDVNSLSVRQNEEFTLTLLSAGYDAEWNPAVYPVENAEITVDGVKTGYKTDENGKVTLKIDEAKNCVISAVSDSAVLVPPVCMTEVSAADSGVSPGTPGENDTQTNTPSSQPAGEENGLPKAGGGGAPIAAAASAAVSVCLIFLTAVRLKKSYEK